MIHSDGEEIIPRDTRSYADESSGAGGVPRRIKDQPRVRSRKEIQQRLRARINCDWTCRSNDPQTRIVVWNSGGIAGPLEFAQALIAAQEESLVLYDLAAQRETEMIAAGISVSPRGANLDCVL